jgi:hypothetical protein
MSANTKTQTRRAQRKRTKAAPKSNGQVKPDKSTMKCVYITPQLATEWLGKNTENRPPSSQSEATLKRTLELGLYRINGETIKFDEDDVLTDGQTRLKAIADTGIAAWSWVCFDIDRDIFGTIDEGRMRTLGHQLAKRKLRNYNSLATAIRNVYQLSEDVAAEPGGFVPRVGLDILAERPEIEASLDFVMQAGVRDIYSLGVAAALHYLMRQCDQALADSYWESLGSGVITNQRSPIRAVRDQLLSNKMATGDRKLSPTTLMAIVIKGWNLLRSGRTCKYIRWNGHESFPAIS